MKNKLLPLSLLVVMIFALILSFLYLNLEPKNISISSYNKGLQIIIHWQNNLNFANAALYRQELPKGPLIKLPTTKSTTFIDKSVIPGHKYKYILTKNLSYFHKSQTLKFYLKDNFTTVKKQLLSQINSHFANNLSRQSWIYDDALGVIVYSEEGNQKKAAKILENLEKIQNPNGSINFFYFTNGQKSEKYIRNGALAWVGYAASVYQTKFNDNSFHSFNLKIAEYLVKSQNNKGAVTGGEGTYTAEGVYLPDKVNWYSTEHNIDSYFYFRELSKIANNKNYSNISNNLKNSLLNKFWDNNRGYFRVGVNNLSDENNPPSEYALDTLSWGGIFLTDVGEITKAKRIPNWLKSHLLIIKENKGTPILGYGLNKAENHEAASKKNIWVEGTWGVILFNLRIGSDCSPLITSMEKIYSTRETAFSDKAWGYLIMSNPNSIWPRD